MEPSPAPAQEPNTPSVAPAPINDVVPAPTQDVTEPQAAAEQPSPVPVPESKVASEVDSSVRLAIIATVVIVIILSALAVLAYMSST